MGKAASSRRPGCRAGTWAAAAGLALSILGSSITKPVIRAVNHYALKDNPPIVMVQAEKAEFGMIACSGPTTPEPPPPPPPPQKVKIYTTLTAKDCFTGLEIAIGQVSYQLPTGSPVVKNLGEQAYLGEINPNTTMSVGITVTVGGYLKRVFKDVALSSAKSYYTLDTTLLDLNGFNLQGFLDYFLAQPAYPTLGAINATYDQNKVIAYFNPDPLTGLRLPAEFIQATIDAINEIALYSKGTINSLTFIENGDKISNSNGNDIIPPDGDAWIFRKSDTDGVGNKPYPIIGTTVKSLKLWYNMSSSAPYMVRKEVMDAFIQGNQNTFLDDYLAKWFEFSLKHRPKGNAFSYRIYLDREEQTGFDGTMTSQGNVLSQTLSDNPQDYSGPSIGSGGYRGYSSPDYSAPRMSGRQDSGAAAKSSRAVAAEKERIRK